MIKERMTIHKALSELKILDSRIDKAIQEEIFCKANKASNDSIAGIQIDDYRDLIKARHQRTQDLIYRRNAIKRAVVMSNAVTKVVIDNAEYTVAEAIEMKNHGMDYHRQMLKLMQLRLATAKSAIEKENGQALQDRVDNYIIALYGQKESKTNADEIAKVKAEFIRNNSFELIDPLNIESEINGLTEYISRFDSEVDSALSVSNALTGIEIEY